MKQMSSMARIILLAVHWQLSVMEATLKRKPSQVLVLADGSAWQACWQGARCMKKYEHAYTEAELWPGVETGGVVIQ